MAWGFASSNMKSNLRIKFNLSLTLVLAFEASGRFCSSSTKEASDKCPLSLSLQVQSLSISFMHHCCHYLVLFSWRLTEVHVHQRCRGSCIWLETRPGGQKKKEEREDVKLCQSLKLISCLRTYYRLILFKQRCKWAFVKQPSEVFWPHCVSLWLTLLPFGPGCPSHIRHWSNLNLYSCAGIRALLLLHHFLNT